MNADEALAMLCQERSLSLNVVRGTSRKTEHVRLRSWLAAELLAANFKQAEIARAMWKHPSSLWSLLHGGKSRKARRAPGLPDVLCSCHLNRQRVA